MRAPQPALALAATAALALAALGPAAPVAGAQQQPRPTPAPSVERPAPFDSAGRVQVITPALAARLRLQAPAFPVQGPFVDARLFAAPDAGDAGPAVLSVTRPGGAVERYPLGTAERAALGAAVASGVAFAGPGLRADTALVISEPAGGAFVRNQTGLGLLIYGPAAAALVGDEAGAGIGVAYAAVAGAAFATSLAVSRQQQVTRAQAILSGNMGLGGAGAGAGILAVLGSEEERAYAAAALVGGVGGSILGFRRAAGMTDAEASASGQAALFGPLLVVGGAGALGVYESRTSEGAARATVGVGVAALGAGYALGPRYARTRRYTVTAGDVDVLTPTALTGAVLGAAAGWAASGSGQAPWLGATAGFVAGTVFGDRLLVRRVDHTQSEGNLVGLGAGIGAALGSAVAGAARARTAGGLTITGLGALGGIALAESILRPAPDGGRRLRTSLVPGGAPALARRVRVSPGGLALARLTAAQGGRGTFPVLSMTF